MNPQLSIPKTEFATFCRAHGIRRFCDFRFGFTGRFRADFGPESDIDVLVEFAPDRVPGLLGVAGMEIELSALFGGRRVELRTPEDLSR